MYDSKPPPAIHAAARTVLIRHALPIPDSPDPATLARELEKLKERVQALEDMLKEDHRKIERIAHGLDHDHTVPERMEHGPCSAGRRNFTVGL